MRKRLSYANVTATLALVFAMSGGAMAANSYLINSTKQINPKVLKKLTGKPGKNGIAGANGATGATGPQGPTGKEGSPGKNGETGKEGKQGEPGPLLTTLPSGKTETGTFSAANTDVSGLAYAFVIAQISYPIPLASEPKVEVIQTGKASTSNCAGTVVAPSASPGWLCVYVQEAFNTGEVTVESVGSPNHGMAPYAALNTPGDTGQIWGSWAVTQH